MIDLVDSHCHLQEPEFEDDAAAALQRAAAAGVSAVLVPGVDLETSRRAVTLSAAHPEVYCAAGYHPHEASSLTPELLSSIEALLAQAKAVAVGEIGLDYYRLHSPREAQLRAFAAQLALAARHSLPVVVHCRDAWEDLAQTLLPWAKQWRAAYRERPLGVLHYFSSDAETARRYYDLGFLISVHTSVTHPRAAMLREVAASLPLEALLVETDSPYGAPQAYRGKRNEPAYVAEAAKAVAEQRGLSLGAVAAATSANARRLFAIETPRPASAGARA